MTTALAVAQTTVARATQSYVRGGMSYCQQFAGNFWEAHFGRQTPNSYASAAAAYRASTIVSTDPQTAPPGAYHYFEYGSLGHVGVALGSGLMASGTGYATAAVANLGKSVYVHRVSDYARHLKYLGWSYTNGARERITGLADASAPSGPNVRTVKSNAWANRRVSPDVNAALTGKDNRLAAGSSHVITKAYLTGIEVTQNGATTDVWFEVGAYGWAWAGGFTSQSLDGIPEVIDARPKLNPEPDPEEPAEPEGPGEPDVEPEPEPETPEPEDPEEEPMPENPITPITEEQENQAAQLGADLLTGKLDVAGWVHARIRTIVPLIIGPALAFLGSRLPGVTEFLTSTLPGWEEIVYGGASAALGYGWWALAGVLGKRWPVVERIMLGSSKRPVYVAPKA